MKIVRLVSDVVSTSQFSKGCSAPIIIKKDGKIGLKSLSFETLHLFDFEVTDASYQLRFTVNDKLQVQGNPLIWYNVTIPRGVYNITSFLEYVTNNMNSYLPSNSNVLNSFGFEWYVSKINDRCSFSFGKSDQTIIQSSDFKVLNCTQNNNFYSKTVPSGIVDSYAQCNKYLCKGGGLATIQISTQNAFNPSTCSFYVGFCNLFDVSTKTTLSNSDFNLAVFSDGTGNYKIIKEDGTILVTNVPIENDDVLTYYKTDNSTAVLSVGKNQVGTELYTFVVPLSFVSTHQFLTMAFGNGCTADFRFFEPEQTASPFIKSSVNGEYTILNALPDVYYNSNLTVTPSRVQLNFLTAIMQSFLGYDASFYVNTGISGSIIGTNPIGSSINTIGDDLIVEVSNLNLDGYDFLENRKSSILAVIPLESLSQKGFGYSYIEPFPTFSSLNNKEDININTFYINIRAGNQLVKLQDRIFMQLLIED